MKKSDIIEFLILAPLIVLLWAAIGYGIASILSNSICSAPLNGS